MEKEMDLSAVIEKIKEDGVSKGEKQAADIIQNAEEKAQAMLKGAEDKKKKILAQAEEETQRMISNGEAALNQSARDVLVALRADIEAFCNELIKKEVARNLQGDKLAEIIKEVVLNCLNKKTMDLELLLPEKDKKVLEGILSGLLNKEIGNGIELKAAPSLKNGFRIGRKGENVYNDFSDEAIAEAFNFYLNKKMRRIIKTD